MNIFIICPVRNGTPPEVAKYVTELEGRGHNVYYPPRDTPQDDPVGDVICKRTRTQVERANEVHIYYSAESQGCHFDLGMAFAYHKKLYLINTPTDRKEKSYLKVILKTIWGQRIAEGK